MIDGAPSYVRFPAIFTPVIDGNRVTRQIGVSIMLELVKGQEKDGVEEMRRQLADAFVTDLYVFFQQRARMRSFDQAYLKGRLLQVASNVVGKNIVQQVLIEQLFEQTR